MCTKQYKIYNFFFLKKKFITQKKPKHCKLQLSLNFMSIHKQDKRIKQKAKAYPVKTLRCLHGLPEGQISKANLTAKIKNKIKLDFINKKENQKRMTKKCN